HAPFAQVVDEALNYFRVNEVQQSRTHIDQSHAHAQRCEHTRVLAPDHARADYGERARKLVELHDVVAGEDAASIERRAPVADCLGTDGEQDGRGADASLQSGQFVFEMENVRIDEACARGRQLDAVAQELMAQDV